MPKTTETHPMTSDEKYHNDYSPDFDGTPWQDAITPCTCGEAPEVWRYQNPKGERPKFVVRCIPCRVEVFDRSRRRTIRRWNEAVESGKVEDLTPVRVIR